MKKEKAFLIIYFIFAAFFLGKAVYYTRKIAFVPDEPAHVSYVVYMSAHTDRIVPAYEDMYYALKPTETPGYFLSNGVRGNYLGHASLYYKLMALSGQVTPEGDGNAAWIHITRLRYLNVLLVMLGLLLYYYIGFTRIPRNREHLGHHMFYAAVTGGVPMMAFLASGITNDNLIYIGFGLFLLGILRYTEGKENTGTYFLIAVGLCTVTLTKLTAGMITVLAAVFFLLADMWKKKRIRILRRGFLWTVPLYAGTLAYYTVVYVRYKTFLPGLRELNPDHFYSSNWYISPDRRPALTNGDLWHSYWQTLSSTWTGIYNGKFTYSKKVGTFFWWPFILILVFALLAAVFLLIRFLRGKKGRSLADAWIPAVFLGFLLTLLENFRSAFTTFRENGRVGGIQARYYVFLAPVFALAGLMFWQKPEEWLAKDAKKTYTRFVNVMLVLFAVWFTWADFPYTWFHSLKG